MSRKWGKRYVVCGCSQHWRSSRCAWMCCCSSAKGLTARRSIACPRLRILAIHFSVPDGPEDIEVRTSAVDILHLLRALHGSGDAASLELVLLGHAARNVQCEVEDFGSRIARIIRHPAFQCLHDVD